MLSPSSMSMESEDTIPYSDSPCHSHPSFLRGATCNCPTCSSCHWGGEEYSNKSQNQSTLQAQSAVQNNCRLNSKRLEISVLRIWFKERKTRMVPTGCSHNRTINITAFWLAAASINHTPLLPHPPPTLKP